MKPVIQSKDWRLKTALLFCLTSYWGLTGWCIRNCFLGPAVSSHALRFALLLFCFLSLPFWEISGAEQKASVLVRCTDAVEVKHAWSNGKAICGEARVVRKMRVQLSLLQSLGTICGFCGAASPNVGLLPQLRVWAASCCRLLSPESHDAEGTFWREFKHNFEFD